MFSCFPGRTDKGDNEQKYFIKMDLEQGITSSSPKILICKSSLKTVRRYNVQRKIVVRLPSFRDLFWMNNQLNAGVRLSVDFAEKHYDSLLLI